MHPLKSSGSDGFHAYFYQHNWQIVGEDIVKFIQTLFLIACIPDDLTQIKLVLIPKVPNPESMTQLRSISLCNTLYKLLTKLLVNRLKPFLLAMIHPAQSRFVPGRRATDNYILAQELLHFIHHQRRKTNLMASKIDLEKAYDKLEWSFIQYTLTFYHFPTPIIELIMACILSSSISILWNGEVSAPFWPSHDIRQGDPLSPLLFILCLNHLSLSLDQALHTKRLSLIRVGRRPIGFNHILFADDIFSCLPRRISRSVRPYLIFFQAFVRCWVRFAVLLNLSYSFHRTLLRKPNVTFPHLQTCLLSKILANI